MDEEKESKYVMEFTDSEMLLIGMGLHELKRDCRKNCPEDHRTLEKINKLINRILDAGDLKK